MQKNWQDFQKNVLGRNKHNNTAAMTAITFIGGTALGVAAGLLMAPDNGKANRAKLTETTRHGMETGRAKIIALRAVLRAKMHHASESTKNAVKEGKHTMGRTKTTAPTVPAAM